MILIPKTLSEQANNDFTGLLGEVVVIPGVGFAVHDNVTKGGLLIRNVSLTAGRNIIRNANFTILQNGTSFTGISGNTHIADCWFSETGGGSTSNVAISNSHREGEGDINNSVRLTTFSGNLDSSFSILSQRYQNVELLAGRTLTLSFRAKILATPLSIALEFGQEYVSATPNTQTLIGRADLTTSWQEFKFTFDTPLLPDPFTTGTDEHSFLKFWLEAGDDFNTNTGGINTADASFDIANVQLEVGAAATPFEFRDKQEEFIRVAVYYEKHLNSPVMLTKIARKGSTDLSGGYVAFVVKKRSLPILTATYDFMDGPIELLEGTKGFSIQGTANSTTSVGRLISYTADSEIVPL